MSSDQIDTPAGGAPLRAPLKSTAVDRQELQRRRISDRYAEAQARVWLRALRRTGEPHRRMPAS